MNAKFHIKIEKSYWPDHIENWFDLTTDQQNAAKIEKMEGMKDLLLSPENANKSILVTDSRIDIVRL